MRFSLKIALLAVLPSAFAWAESVAPHEEMTQARQNPEIKVDTSQPGVASRLFLDSRKIITNQPTEADQKKAYELMLQAAELNYPQAMLHVATFYSDGMGVEQNFEEAMLWYRRVAESVEPELVNVAQNNIGLFYYRGQGVTKDRQESLKWLQRAVDNGNTKAINNLKFVKGHILTLEAMEIMDNQPSKADEKKAFELLREGAEGNYPWAMLYTASNYQRGRGVKQNFKEAMRRYLAVAELNHKTARVAQNNIGFMYYRGESVAKDHAEAIKWLQRAVDNGHPKAAKALKHIRARTEDHTLGRAAPTVQTSTVRIE